MRVSNCLKVHEKVLTLPMPKGMKQGRKALCETMIKRGQDNGSRG